MRAYPSKDVVCESLIRRHQPAVFLLEDVVLQHKQENEPSTCLLCKQLCAILLLYVDEAAEVFC